MLGPYVDMIMSRRRGNCNDPKMLMITLAMNITGITIHDRLGCIKKRAVEKVIIMVAIEKKRVASPTIIFVGKDLRKSCSSYRDVRIVKNINTDVDEENSDSVSDTMKIVNNFLSENIGKPVFGSLPPGTVKATANIIVIIRAPTTVQDVAVVFIQSSPSFFISLWASVNSFVGLSSKSLTNVSNSGDKNFSTSCIY